MWFYEAQQVIADSFEGEEANKKFTENLLLDRQCAKADKNAREFYSYMHGSDWEQIVDNDTSAIIRHANEIGQFFHKPLQDLKADILFTGKNVSVSYRGTSCHDYESG